MVLGTSPTGHNAIESADAPNLGNVHKPVEEDSKAIRRTEKINKEQV